MANQEEVIQMYEEEIQRLENEKQGQQQAYQQQYYAPQQKQNLVEWELDFKPELEGIGRSLRCDIITMDKDGNEYWSSNPDQSKIFLNETGVNDVLRKIVLLVNKNKVLSNYTLEEIQQRVRMIGHELRTLIYTNYEAYGIDNEYKENNYSSIVMDVLSIIEDAYRRALAGETHKGLNEQRLVTQSESVAPNYQNYPMVQQKRSHWYNPMSWGK